MASFGDEGLHVEREPSLEDPETLEADGSAKAKIGNKELGVDGKGQAEDGGKRRDEGGDGVALGLEIGGLGSSGGGGG